MRRFFCKLKDISGGRIVISAGPAHHIKDVLRLAPDSPLTVADNRGRVYDCVIEKFSDKQVFLQIKRKRPPNNKKIRLTVACAIPKKSKMDDIIDKLTQLGVERIIPLETKRGIVKLDKAKAFLRQERWQKIAQAGAQQSQRDIVPVIDPVRDFNDFVNEEDFDLKLIPHLSGRRRPLKNVLRSFSSGSLLVLIGPEGDFTEDEVETARRKGFIPVSLGSLVLRVETAAVAVSAYISLNADD